MVYKDKNLTLGFCRRNKPGGATTATRRQRRPPIENKSSSNAFGFQLLLDLYDCRPGVCDDLALCYRFLDEIVGRLGMEKQAPPNIFRSDEVRFPDKAGLSGWVPLIESSVVIHTLTPKNFISIDIYCCKAFDKDLARQICRDFFKPARVDEQYIERGQDYYKTDSTYHSLEVTKDGNVPIGIDLTKKETELIR